MPFFKTITNQEDSVRLDRFLRRHFSSLPQSSIEKSLRKGEIKVNDVRIKKTSFRLSYEDKVDLYCNFEKFKEVSEEKPTLSTADRKIIENSIIFEDDDILVMNKPNGLATQGGTNIKRDVDRFLQSFKKGVQYRLVHRLDKDTSGILLLAKSIEVAKHLTNLFKTKEIKKTYLAVVHGQMMRPEGIIDAPLLKDFKDHKEIMIVSDDGKNATTEYKVLACKEGYSLVELFPLTGRTHQLRVHMAHINHPIVGDYKYGHIESKTKNRLHLHAQKITYHYGKSKRPVSFEAPIIDKDLFSLFY